MRSVIEPGLTQRRVVVLSYRDGKGAASRREVEPQLLARTADREYLVAWCREREALRWFREDRIEARSSPPSPPRVATRRRSALRPAAVATRPHPAGRALRAAGAGGPARLVLLPGGA